MSQFGSESRYVLEWGKGHINNRGLSLFPIPLPFSPNHRPFVSGNKSSIYKLKRSQRRKSYSPTTPSTQRRSSSKAAADDLGHVRPRRPRALALPHTLHPPQTHELVQLPPASSQGSPPRTRPAPHHRSHGSDGHPRHPSTSRPCGERRALRVYQSCFSRRCRHPDPPPPSPVNFHPNPSRPLPPRPRHSRRPLPRPLSNPQRK
ncbi:hypothetical protein FA13DRAFT_977786 [Coprinellus micaceus]|uniref:Uncharacterized protein n=1 Tax=Coprinellus micaceus TaxID=71717 RepID=A0A4Y7SZQ3_COPMI|nr:hypothetical protein FA13DRAFT_977786 [Coprinellus micaceus]